MDWGLFWAAVSGVCAIVSVSVTVVAGLLSRYSKRAKEDAEAARDFTRRQLEAAETTADHLGEIRGHMSATTMREPLELSFVRGSLYRLRNNTSSMLVIDRIENQDRFLRIDLKPGTEIVGHGSTEFLIAGAWGLPVPGELVVRLSGSEAATAIPIPPKS